MALEVYQNLKRMKKNLTYKEVKTRLLELFRVKRDHNEAMKEVHTLQFKLGDNVVKFAEEIS